MFNDKDKKEQDRQKRKESIKEAFNLIAILLMVFLVLLLSSDGNKMKKGSNFIYDNSKSESGGQPSGEDKNNISKDREDEEDKDEENEEEIDEEEKEKEYERLEKSLEETKEESDEPNMNISQNDMARNKNEARQKLKKEKDAGGIQIRITSFYLKKGTDALIVEGIVGNYTEKTLSKPRVKASFYDENEEVLDESENILGSGGDLKSDMVVDFRVESIDDPILRRFGRSAHVELTGIWER